MLLYTAALNINIRGPCELGKAGDRKLDLHAVRPKNVRIFY